MAIHHPLTMAFGLLGNIISFMAFLAPMSPFYTIYKKKTTEGFQALPYMVACFMCMLWIYYALLKQNAIFLMTTNSFGCLTEIGYLAIFLFYSPKKARISTMKLILMLNVLGYGFMLALTVLLAKGEKRLKIVGWICLVFNILVFDAPLAILKKVIRTKSVEFMPFLLSFSLTLNVVAWFFYGFLLKDHNIAFPNILGFIFGIAQMVLYMVYKNSQIVPVAIDEPSKVKDLSVHNFTEVMEISPDTTPVVLEINLTEIVLDPNVVKEIKIQDRRNQGN